MLLINVNMTMERKITFCTSLVFILIICSTQFYTVESVNVPKLSQDTEKMLNIIACPTIKFIDSTEYAETCNKLHYPKEYNEKNTDLAMCIIVYDIMNKICEYNSKIVVDNESKIKVPGSVIEFDSEMKKLEPNFNNNETQYETFVNNFCKNKTSIFNNLNSLDVHSSNEIIPYIKYVNETLLGPHFCNHACSRPTFVVNPFCMILLWADKLFTSVKSRKISNNINTNSIKKNPSPAASDIENNKQLMNENKNVQTEQENSPKNEVHTNNVNNEPLNQSIEQQSPSTGSKKPAESKIKPVDVPGPIKKNLETSKIENQGKEEANIPVPPKNDKLNPVVSKAVESLGESANVAQQEERNPGNEFFSGKEHQDKKENVNDVDDINDRDNTDNDLKESLNNSDDRMVVGNPVDQHDLPQEEKKIFPHASTLKEEDESHFFTYFSIVTLLCTGLYVGYHNKQKILAMVLEGRRSRRSRGSRRRPSTASYRKLDCNLEEAVTSQCNSNVTHVIY